MNEWVGGGFESMVGWVGVNGWMDGWVRGSLNGWVFS